MKKFLALVLAMLMVFSLCACGNGGDSGEKVVKIGVFEPLTGDSAAGGKQEVLGMQYANSKVPTVEIGGETYKVEALFTPITKQGRQGCFRSIQPGCTGCFHSSRHIRFTSGNSSFRDL